LPRGIPRRELFLQFTAILKLPGISPNRHRGKAYYWRSCQALATEGRENTVVMQHAYKADAIRPEQALR